VGGHLNSEGFRIIIIRNWSEIFVLFWLVLFVRPHRINKSAERCKIKTTLSICNLLYRAIIVNYGLETTDGEILASGTRSLSSRQAKENMCDGNKCDRQALDT